MTNIGLNMTKRIPIMVRKTAVSNLPSMHMTSFGSIITNSGFIMTRCGRLMTTLDPIMTKSGQK